ncbi:MAG: hypothetical protein J5J06_13840 [Phycisphaerae bacterium]|nr:hypothetical protein [Phycisphaerae bacterium]
MPQADAASPPLDAAARVDSDLVARAYRKVMSREELTRQERDALRRHEKAKEERLRWQHYSSIPQKHWRQMSGRQTKILNEQAERYGIPFGGRFIDLPKVVRALHDFLAANKYRLASESDDMLQGGSSPALERYRTERAELARLDRLERQRQLLPRDEVREALGQIASILREAGESLQRQFGRAAAEVLYEALDDAEREITRTLGHEAEGQATGDREKPRSDEATEPRREEEAATRTKNQADNVRCRSDASDA